MNETIRVRWSSFDLTLPFLGTLLLATWSLPIVAEVGGGWSDFDAAKLDKLFESPPDWAQPSGYWWWLNGRIDKEGITRDLEEFRAKGLGGVLLVCSSSGEYGGDPVPEGPVAFLSLEWRKLFRFALDEAHRLSLEVGVNLCGGWAMGGPWIAPENSGRWFLQSELTVTGPRKFSDHLPLPGPRDGYDSPPQLNVKKVIGLPLEQVDYRDTAVVAFRETSDGNRLRGDRKRELAPKSNRLDGDCFMPARQVMDQTLTPWTTQPGDVPIAPAEVVDLTAKVSADGRLEWDVPEGTWTILRTGHRMTGIQVSLPMPGSEGLEVDWFSAEAVDQHWNHLGKILLEEAGSHVGKTLRYFLTDSFEAGYPNWTARILEAFRTYRGYDATPYLPVLRGRLVGSAEISDRFLHDYRKTVADCMADRNYGHFAKLAQPHGMLIACEAGGPSWSGTLCMDALKNLGRCAMPQGEFWQSWHFVTNNQNQVGKQTASAAHTYGRPTASAEAFTSIGPQWEESPASLKPTADRAFCEGINRLVFHTLTATRPQDGLPGYEYGAGTHFNPNVTWWQQAAGPWLSYLGRCQALLQSGVFVADVLYYNGDWSPNLVEPKHTDPSLGKGYDYDVCNVEVLLTRLSVQDGRLVLPEGIRYRLLVLPDTTRMPVEVARRIRDLAAAGATVVGRKPQSDPGLGSHPECDAEVRRIAEEVWGDCDGQTIKQHPFGKGRIVWGRSLRDILLGDGITPDFVHSGGDAFIDFIHRRVGEVDIYFLANRNQRAEFVVAEFRVSGRQPELWDPVSGQRRDLPQFSWQQGVTSVPLEFEPHGSMFVVFRHAATPAKGKAKENVPKCTPLMELTGAWQISFDPDWFYPTNDLSGEAAKGVITFGRLEDWSKRSEPAIRHFSGTAVYRKTFDVSRATPNQCLFLDLGTVKETARVRLNGKELGVVWCAPWRVDITDALKRGENRLEIEVVNLWPNRLIGDAGLPPEAPRTRTNIRTFKKTSPLLSSGLLGPVTIQTTGRSAPGR